MVQHAVTTCNDSPEHHSDRTTNDRLTVAVRVRPLLDKEACRVPIVTVLNENIVTLRQDESDKGRNVLRKNRDGDKHFAFDLAFGEFSTQKEIYEKTTRTLIDDVIKGSNATVFAYGPTGSGKTHTMVGTEEQPGIMVRALNDIFKAMQHNTEHIEFQMTLSYLEIYNESIRDLLNPSSGVLDLREDGKKGTIEVTGLSAITTMSTNEVMQLLSRGNKERTVEATAANKSSSRSHALLQVNVRQYSRIQHVNELIRSGKLFMVDLAGSERAKRTKNCGQRLKEGGHINRSLLALGNCINALAVNNNKYVNYRDSKLTRLLKDALAGNCRTVMIAHVSAVSSQRDETFNTLVYADRAKNITKKMKPSTLNVTHQVAQYQNIITELRDEIGRLKTRLTQQNDCRLEENDPSEQNEEAMRLLRAELVDLFKDQMELRQQMIEVDNVLLWLAMEFEKHTLIISQHNSVMSCSRREQPDVTGAPSDDVTDSSASLRSHSFSDESEMEDSAELSQAWDDLRYIQEEEARYQEMKRKIQVDLDVVKKKACHLQENLPQKTTSDEQRELLEMLLRTHLLEIENIEIRRNQLIKDHELRRRDIMILRYDRQRSLCDEIIARQRQVIDDMETGRYDRASSIPTQLKHMYSVYTQELNSDGVRNCRRFVNQLSQVMRSPSEMVDLNGDIRLGPATRTCNQDSGHLPPINDERTDALFERRFHQCDERPVHQRSGTALSIHSSSSSGSAHSAVAELRLPRLSSDTAVSAQMCPDNWARDTASERQQTPNKHLNITHNFNSDDLYSANERAAGDIMSHWNCKRSQSCASSLDQQGHVTRPGDLAASSLLGLPSVASGLNTIDQSNYNTQSVRDSKLSKSSQLPSLRQKKSSTRESLI